LTVKLTREQRFVRTACGSGRAQLNLEFGISVFDLG